MNGLGYTLRFFAADLAPTLLFLAVFLITRNIYLATGMGIAIGLGQLIWCVARNKPVGPLQWASLGLVVVFGGATLLTQNPRFIMLKPTAISLILGAVMLKRGWMSRYVPPAVRETAGPMLNVFGYVWAGLMFLTGALNLILVFTVDPVSWALFNAWFGPVSMIGLFVIQNAYTRTRAARAGFIIPPGEAPLPFEGRDS